jgi:hypothetical protein
MGSSPLLVASVIAVALIVVQVTLITLRNAVRNRLFPVTTDAPPPAPVHTPSPPIRRPID